MANDQSAPTPETTPSEADRAVAQRAAVEAHYGLPDEQDGEAAAVVPAPAPDQPQAPASSPRPPHPAWLRAQALDLGFAEAEVDGMSTNELGAAVRYTTRQLVQRERSTPAAPPAPAATPPEEEDVDIGLPEEEFDPRLVKAVKGIARSAREEVKALKAQLAEQKQREEQRERQISVEQIDQGFADLGADYEKYLGKGSCADFQNSDPQYLLRDAVVKSVATNPPKGGLSWRKAIAQRAREMFGGSTGSAEHDAPPVPAAPSPRSQAALEKPRDGAGRFTREQWDAAALNRPTQRNGAAEPNGRAKAEKAVAEKLREYDAQNGEEDFPDGTFPD